MNRMNHFTWISLVLVIVLLLVVADPFMLFMPGMGQMLLLLAAAVLAVLYAGFIAKEQGGDERELLHRTIAGRAGFLAGISVLTVALVVQGLAHAIDLWIPLALIAMIAAKAIARAWAERNR